MTAPAGGWAISIHALREEGDRHTPNSEHGLDDFYPRPPRGGRRASPVAFLSLLTFLSTPSARRATSIRQAFGMNFEFLSTPSARRATFAHSTVPNDAIFLSTPSARRATSISMSFAKAFLHFYPRPPRGGRQNCAPPPCLPSRYFYPRPPRGGRRQVPEVNVSGMKFLAPPSARRATLALCHRGPVRQISIHALREEGDRLLR